MQKSFLYLCLPWYLSIVQGYLCIDLRRDNTLDPRNVDQNNWHLKTLLGPIFQVLVRRWRLRSLTYWIQYFQRTTDKRDHLIYAYIEYINCYLEILNKSDSLILGTVRGPDVLSRENAKIGRLLYLFYELYWLFQFSWFQKGINIHM